MPYTSPILAITAPCLGETITVASQATYAATTEAAIATVEASAAKALLRPTVLLRGSVAFTVGVPVVVPFNSEVLDTDNMWSLGAPTIVTVNTAGTYLITVVSSTNLQNNSSHRAEILINGNPVAATKSGPGFAGTSPPSPMMIEATVKLAVADQITVRVTITGVDNNITSPQFSAVLISYGGS